MNLNFSKAYNDLVILIDEIEDDNLQLDELAGKIKQAKRLIDFCEKKNCEI